MVDHLTYNVTLNVSKTKEMVVDFRKQQTGNYTPLIMNGTSVKK